MVPVRFLDEIRVGSGALFLARLGAEGLLGEVWND